MQRPNSITIKDLIVFGIAFAAIAWLFMMIPGCACTSCRADDVKPSPQSATRWRAARVPLPTPVVPQNQLPAPRPANDFATPPSDGPDPSIPEPVVPEPVAPNPPAPVPTAPPSPTGTAELTTTQRASGAVNILGNTGTVIFGDSQGVGVPQTASPAVAPQQSIPLTSIVAIATNPQVQSTAATGLRRIGGGLYYALTGKCPSPRATAVPASYVMPQAAYMASVPVAIQQSSMIMAVPQMAVQAQPAYLMAPAPAPSPMVLSTPQILGTPPPPKKCRFFGHD